MSLNTAAKHLAQTEQQLLLGYETVINLLNDAAAAPTDLLAEYNQRVAELRAQTSALAAFWQQVGLSVYGPKEPAWLPRFSVEDWTQPVTSVDQVKIVAGDDPGTGPGLPGQLGNPLIPLAAQGIRVVGYYFIYKGIKAIGSPWGVDIARYEAMAEQARANASSFKTLATEIATLTRQCSGGDPARVASCVRDITAQMATIRDSIPKNASIPGSGSAIKTIVWLAVVGGLGYGAYRIYRSVKRQAPEANDEDDEDEN